MINKSKNRRQTRKKNRSNINKPKPHWRKKTSWRSTSKKNEQHLIVAVVDV